MLSSVDKKFEGLTTSKAITEFLNNVDVTSKRVGQSYVDPAIEKDVPKRIKEMIGEGWENQLHSKTPAQALSYAMDKVKDICMDHIAEKQRSKSTEGLIRPLDGKRSGNDKGNKATAVVANSSHGSYRRYISGKIAEKVSQQEIVQKAEMHPTGRTTIATSKVIIPAHGFPIETIHDEGS
jgi:hypothetical protein